MRHRQLSLARGDNLEGWDGAGPRREVQEGRDLGLLTADSRRCVAEADTAL